MAKYGDHREGMGGLGVNDPGGKGFGADKTGQGPGNDNDNDNDKDKDFSGLGLTFGDDGKLVTFGEDKTPVGLTQRYFTNNPENIQPAYDAGLMGTGLASTFSGQGLLNTKPLTNANTNINTNINPNINPVTRLNILNPYMNQLALDEEEEKKSFLDNAFKNFDVLGEEAFIDEIMKTGVSEDVAKLASAKMNISPGEAYGMVSNFIDGTFSSGEDLVGAGYNAAIASALTPSSAGLLTIGTKGILPMFEAALGPTIESASSAFANSKLGKYLQEKGLNIGTYNANKYLSKSPQNFKVTGFTGPMTMNEDGNLVQKPTLSYTGPMTAAIADEVAEIQGGYLSPDQQAELAIERYNALETEKNSRPGNLAALAPGPVIDPVRSKYEDEALEAYDRYIERGYTPEEAEYLVAYMGLA